MYYIVCFIVPYHDPAFLRTYCHKQAPLLYIKYSLVPNQCSLEMAEWTRYLIKLMFHMAGLSLEPALAQEYLAFSSAVIPILVLVPHELLGWGYKHGQVIAVTSMDQRCIPLYVIKQNITRMIQYSAHHSWLTKADISKSNQN